MSLSVVVKSTIHHIKLLLLFLIDLIFSINKYVKFKLSGKHEVERICESQTDVYDKTLKVDQWLERTKCKQIHEFFERNFHSHSEDNAPKRALNRILNSYRKKENNPSRKKIKGNLKKTITSVEYLEEGDTILNDVTATLSDELFEIIRKHKLPNVNPRCRDCLRDVLYRIISYRTSLFITEQLAATKYDASVNAHKDKLVSLWNHLVRADNKPSQPDESTNQKAFPPELSNELDDKSNVVSSRWSHIGFQGEDPGTDFRGMGLLGLTQLEYLARKPKRLARDLLKRSLNEEHTYPFAIVGINITYNLLNLFKDGSMKHLYYDTGDILFRNNQRVLNLLTTFNDIYVELFLRFDCFWHESKPETIFEFKGLMEQFVRVVRMDLSNRNFSLKFIY